MSTANYLRRQAEALVHLSRATIDLAIAARLRALASDFHSKADELDQVPGDFSAMALPQHAPSLRDQY